DRGGGVGLSRRRRSGAVARRSGRRRSARLARRARIFVMAANDGAFASFVQKWLAANPEQVAVGVFLAPEARLRASGFGALVHELAETAFATREPQVAAAKLAWWRQDLAADEPRHPIAKTLMADAQAAAIDPALWSALVDGALAELDAPPPADLAAAFAVLNAFYGP